jgi:hypothetical protein
MEGAAVYAHIDHGFSAASMIPSPDSISRGGVSVVGISSVQDYLAADPLPSPQDYYAAALALFGIILFAKFASRTRATPPRSNRERKSADGAHWVCVAAAALGACFCFFALGWASGNGGGLRYGVWITAAISGGILVCEVGRHKPPETQTPAVSSLTLDKAQEIVGQLAQPHPDPTDVERAAVLLADKVTQLRDEVTQLRDEVTQLRDEVTRLQGQLGGTS